MTKVGKSDGEGTFPGTRGNDKVAPSPVVQLSTGQRARSTQSRRSKTPRADGRVAGKRPLPRVFTSACQFVEQRLRLVSVSPWPSTAVAIVPSGDRNRPAW